MNGQKHQKRDCNCQVSIFPRLHLTLIGMDDKGYRRNGGIGFSITQPQAFVCVSLGSDFSIRDNRRWPLQKNELRRLKEMSQQFANVPVQIEISGEMPSHYGFGSATAIRLAILAACRSEI
jgi:beta-ribofuranosylaminobenzene 5'-phosphate synthase